MRPTLHLLRLSGLLFRRQARRHLCRASATSAATGKSTAAQQTKTATTASAVGHRRPGIGFDSVPSHSNQRHGAPAELVSYTRVQRDWRSGVKYGSLNADPAAVADGRVAVDIVDDAGTRRPVSLLARAAFEAEVAAKEAAAAEQKTEEARTNAEASSSGVVVASSPRLSPDTYRELLAEAGADLAAIDAEAAAADPALAAALAHGSGRVSRHGSEDPTVPVSRYPCHGCGAPLQCANLDFAGFVPAEAMAACASQPDQMRSLLCLRCHLLRQHDQALEASLGADQWPAVLEAVRQSPRALLVHIVDMTRLPMTIVPELQQLIDTNRQLIVVANKADLLCRDAIEFEKRWATRIRSYCRDAGLTSVAKVMLLSAKTGHNVERLVSYLMAKIDASEKLNFFLLGCTNVGKSRVFNTLLESDLCRVQVEERFHRATVSPLAGTTLGSLKFPLIRVTRERLARRAYRLGDEKAATRLLLGDAKESKRLDAAGVWRGRVGRTFTSAGLLKPSAQAQPQQNLLYVPTYRMGAETDTVLAINDADAYRRVMRSHLQWQEPDERQFGRWCHDTPGLAKEYAIESFLTESEWEAVFKPTKMVIPRTFVMKPGLSLLIGGLARLDIIGTEKPCTVYVTCHSFLANIHLVDTPRVDEYLAKFGHLLYSADHAARPRQLPRLSSRQLRRIVCPAGEPEAASCDVVFSALGWASVYALSRVDAAVGIVGAEEEDVEDANPDLHVRAPSLQSLAVRMRGRRVAFTKEFHASAELPEPTTTTRRLAKAKRQKRLLRDCASVGDDSGEDGDDDVEL